MQALKNEIKQKAIFMSLINIKETIKNIQDSADAEVMVIFCEEDMKRLVGGKIKCNHRKIK